MEENNLKEEPISQPIPVSAANAAVIDEMAKAGVLYGRRKSKTHPRMKRYISGIRNTIEIFDLNQTLTAIEKAQEFLKEVIKKGGMVFLVGTQPAAKALIKDFAAKFNFPYVTERWLGGTLTNFAILSQRIAYYIKLKKDREAGVFEKYTKKERLDIDRKIDKLTINFFGLENLKRLPDVLIAIDTNLHDIAVREAILAKIPVIALINSDADPEKITYPIPANSNTRSSIALILKMLEETIGKTKSEKPAVEPKPK